MSCCTSLVKSLPAMGMDWMAEPMTKPSETGMTCVQPAPLSMTVPVIFPRALCTEKDLSVTMYSDNTPVLHANVLSRRINMCQCRS